MSRYEWKQEETIVSGLWKFSPKITLEDLQKFAAEWKRMDRNLQEVYIRGVGKNGALGIGFKYQLQGIYDPDNMSVRRPPEKVQADFFHKQTDILRRVYGDDFVGWDVSRPTWTLVVS